tara:strand:- start:6460 stop:6942 length:483 start_codon:yes stop_codon:yes gene_type:complete
MKFRTEHVDFNVIQPVWFEKLWPGRNSDIKPMSSMTYDGKIDMSIYDKFKPTFVAVYNNADTIIGVNSGHQTGDNMYRSRGVWVDPLYRKQGIAGILFCEIEGKAMEEKCKTMWSLPRKESLPAYEKYGFIKTSDFFDEGMEFGPNCYVKKELDYEFKPH